jgi:hypothetical protein
MPGLPSLAVQVIASLLLGHCRAPPAAGLAAVKVA